MALSALVNALACAGEPDTAVKCGHEALAGLENLLGPDHPHTVTVRANLKIMQSGLPPEAGSFLQTRLVEIDFTPLPL
jgi:hypothetical protein